MDKLSVEILNSIFVQIHLLNKLECMLVCRKWASIIRGTTLLDTIHLNNKRDFDRFFEMLLHNPSQRNQVKRLVLNRYFKATCNGKLLLELLPKLQFFEIHRLIEDRSDVVTGSTPVTYDLKRLESLRYHIEHILDYEDSLFSELILDAGLCPRLTVLEINMLSTFGSIDSLVTQLRNAPALRKLKIMNAFIKMTELEELHANIPQLYSLSIGFSDLLHQTLPLSIKPAKLVTNLSLHFGAISIETHIVWFQFIRLKYPSLQQFGFTEHRINVFLEEEFRNRIISNGLVPLLQSLGTRLKSLELSSTFLEPDLFKNIDKYNPGIAQFTTFCIQPRHVIPNIIQSSQCKFVQKLKLEYTPLFSIEIIKEMIYLKSLELYFESFLPQKSKPTINLHRLFEFSPNTLETLRIDNAHLNCDATFNHTFPLKKFTFCGAKLSKRVERFLSFCLPNLRTLYLIDCVSSGSRLIFPNIKLTHLEIVLEDPDYYPDVSVFTLDSNLLHYYTIPEKDDSIESIEHTFGYADTPLYKGQRRIPLYELSPNGLISVECISLQNLVLNGHLAC